MENTNYFIKILFTKKKFTQLEKNAILKLKLLFKRNINFFLIIDYFSFCDDIANRGIEILTTFFT